MIKNIEPRERTRAGAGECVMQDAAESISTIDGVELNLCEACSAYVFP